MIGLMGQDRPCLDVACERVAVDGETIESDQGRQSGEVDGRQEILGAHSTASPDATTSYASLARSTGAKLTSDRGTALAQTAL